MFQFDPDEDFSSFVIGDQRRLGVEISFGAGLTARQALYDISFDPNAKAVAFSGLPESFRKDYESALANLRKRYETVPRPKPRVPPPKGS